MAMKTGEKRNFELFINKVLYPKLKKCLYRKQKRGCLKNEIASFAFLDKLLMKLG